MGSCSEMFDEGMRRARRDRFFHGRKFVKFKAESGLEGHTWVFRSGYRDYARRHCPVRRMIDF